MPDERQLKRFGEAVERKKKSAKEASEQAGDEQPSGSPVEGDQDALVDSGRPQDVASPRDKNTRKGKVTADKWNQ